MDIDEAKIIQDCQKGQAEQFGLLYNKYIKKIYNFIYYRILHTQTAEDLTSIVFTKAFSKLNKFNSKKGSFSAWLYQIARNTLTDYYRSKKVDYDIDGFWNLSDKTDLIKELDLKDKLGEVKQYLNKLPLAQRELIIMRIWDGLSYKEISNILGKSEASCKMMFSRALNKLREDLPLSIITIILINFY
jgi:RNA polymerase sigma-70 factor (ECF subfamily)